MTVLDALERVRAAAEADATGDPAAHKTLLDEIHKLRLAAETPAEKCMRKRFEILDNLCIRVALELGILQAIAAKKGSVVSAAQLSRETGADELMICTSLM